MKPPSTELFFYLLEIIPLKTNFKGGGRKFTEFACSDPGMAMDMELCITGPETGKIDHTLHCHVMLFQTLAWLWTWSYVSLDLRLARLIIPYTVMLYYFRPWHGYGHGAMYHWT